MTTVFTKRITLTSIALLKVYSLVHGRTKTFLFTARFYVFNLFNVFKKFYNVFFI